MALVRHPNLQNVNGKYAEGATVTAITNRDTEAAADAYEDEGGVTPVSYPVASGSEGELDIWVPVGAYETTFGDDTVDTPAVWEAISGEEIADMLTVEDIPGFPANVISPLDYGGDPTGVSDSTVALQAAIDQAIEDHGVVDLGNGDATWKFSSTLTGGLSFRMTGECSATGSGPTLYYTGTGTSPAINFSGMRRFELDHFKCVYNNSAFTGPFILLLGTVAGDISRFSIHDMFFERESPMTPDPEFNCQGFIVMTKAIIGSVKNCAFDGAESLIVLGNPAASGSRYVNNVQISNCTFNDTNENVGGTGAQILIGSNDLEAVQIDNCSFEAAGAANLSAIKGANTGLGDAGTNVIYTLNIQNCWFGDGAPDAWIWGLNNHTSGRINIIGNYFGATGGKHLQAGQDGSRWTIIGNNFRGGVSSVIGVHPDLVAFGGNYNVELFSSNHVEGLRFDPGDGPGTNWIQLARDDSRLHGRLGIQSSDDFDTIANWENDPEECLVIGGTTVSSAAGILDIGNRAGIYAREASGGGKNLELQASSINNNGEVQIIAGATPALKLRANNTGLGFYGTAPGAKPDITGSRTDGTALADLLASLAALGLITNSSSA